MRKTVRAFGLTLWLAGFAFAQAGSPEQEFARALELQSSGDYEGAVRAWRAVLALDSSNFGAHANLGAALAHQGEYDSAIAEYRAALGRAPTAAVPAIRQNIGLALYKSGRLSEAAAEFEAVRRLGPAQSNAVLLEADCYLRMGAFPRVIDLLGPLQTSQENDRAIAYMLGMAYIRSGQAEKGQALIDRLMRGGESAETHFLLGSVAFMAKDYPAAAKELSAAANLDPALSSVYSYYGRALLFSGDPDGAAEAFRKQLAADANDYDANFQFAEILRSRRDFAGAAPLYTKAVRLRPESAEAQYGLALCRLAAGDAAGAREILKNIVADAPDYADAHRALGEADDRLGFADEARRERELAAKAAGSAETDGGIPKGSPAPDFNLLPPSGEARVRLSSMLGEKPAVVVFGSYTCPKFRSQADALNRLYDRYGGRAGFLLVYIREAHSDSSWQSAANERERVALPDAADMKQKRDYASMCLRRLKIRYPAVVDDMDNLTEKRWAAFPSRVYVIDRSGKIVFNSLLDQQRFDADALEAALKAAL